MSEFELGFEDGAGDSLVSGDADEYKGITGKTDRIAIIYKRSPLKGAIPPAIQDLIEKNERGVIERGNEKFLVSPWVKAALTHYVKGIGRFRCLSERDAKGRITKKCSCCDKEEAVPTFVAPIVHYITKKDGTVLNPLQYEIKVWRMSEDKYKILKRKNMEDEQRKIIASDILITCQEAQYQKLDISIQSKCLWRIKPTLEDDIYEQAMAIEKIMDKTIGKKLTEEQYREKIGAAPVEITAEDLKGAKAEDFSDLEM